MTCHTSKDQSNRRKNVLGSAQCQVRPRMKIEFSDQVYRPSSLLAVQSDLWSSFACLNPCTHLLDLCGLLFHSRSERRNFLLKVLHSAMLFEEFIQQHRVYRLVAHSVHFAVVIAYHQIGADRLHVLSHQAKLRGLLQLYFLLVSQPSASSPMAVLWFHVVSLESAKKPTAVL